MAQYELLTIGGGEETVLLSTTDRDTIIRRYKAVSLMRPLRIRIDGRMLSIIEADKFCGCTFALPVSVRGERTTNNGRCRPVEQLDADGKVIARYASVTQAARANQVSKNVVLERCNGRIGYVHGLMFRYGEGGGLL